MERDYHPSFFLHPIESVTLLDSSRKPQVNRSCTCDPANTDSSSHVSVSISKNTVFHSQVLPLRGSAINTLQSELSGY